MISFVRDNARAYLHAKRMCNCKQPTSTTDYGDDPDAPDAASGASVRAHHCGVSAGLCISVLHVKVKPQSDSWHNQGRRFTVEAPSNANAPQNADP
jgi:hypothetical protein